MPAAATATTPVVFRCPRVAEPFGGVRLIQRHAQTLAEAGFAASVESCGASARTDGIRVVPETDLDGLRAPGRKIVFAQSFAFRSSCPRGTEWAELGVEGAVAVSQTLAEAIERHTGFAPAVLAPSVDPDLFRPAPKERTIAFMPRRNKAGIEEILDLARPRGFAPLPIDRLPHHEVAERLSSAAIFLAAEPSEGFGLPALEAMASGCIVVGFTGGGGRDFMRDGLNCLLADDGDNLHAARQLRAAMHRFLKNNHLPMTDRAVLTAREFSPAREAAAVLAFWKRVLSP